MDLFFILAISTFSLIVFFLQKNLYKITQSDYKKETIDSISWLWLIAVAPIILAYLLINTITQNPVIKLVCYLLAITIFSSYYYYTQTNFPYINIFTACGLTTIYLITSKNFLSEAKATQIKEDVDTISKPITATQDKSYAKKDEHIFADIAPTPVKVTPSFIENKRLIESAISISQDKNIDKSNSLNQNEERAIVINNPSELFRVKEDVILKKNNQNLKKPTKIYELDNDLIRKIGVLGEEFVMKYEIEKLQKIGKFHLVSNVKHIPTHYGDINEYGCDIISYNSMEEEIKIEVKTTTGGKNTLFYLTENEHTHLINSSNYLIYRVYDFDVEKKCGPIIIINTKDELNKYFTITEAKYVAKPKK